MDYKKEFFTAPLISALKLYIIHTIGMIKQQIVNKNYR